MRRLLVILLFLVVGCASAPVTPPAPVVVLDAAGYAAEFQATYVDLTWPVDYRPELSTLIKVTAPDPGQGVEKGYSRRVLDVVNTCAWYKSWDSAVRRHDSATANAALTVMTDVLTGYPPPIDTAGRVFVQDAADHARSGNPDLARQYVLSELEARRGTGRATDENPDPQRHQTVRHCGRDAW